MVLVENYIKKVIHPLENLFKKEYKWYRFMVW